MEPIKGSYPNRITLVSTDLRHHSVASGPEPEGCILFGGAAFESVGARRFAKVGSIYDTAMLGWLDHGQREKLYLPIFSSLAVIRLRASPAPHSLLSLQSKTPCARFRLVPQPAFELVHRFVFGKGCAIAKVVAAFSRHPLAKRQNKLAGDQLRFNEERLNHDRFCRSSQIYLPSRRRFTDCSWICRGSFCGAIHLSGTLCAGTALARLAPHNRIGRKQAPVASERMTICSPSALIVCKLDFDLGTFLV